MAEPRKVSLQDQIVAAKRELKMRQGVYPRRVAGGKMTQDLADRETRNMEAIVETLEGLERAERLI